MDQANTYEGWVVSHDNSNWRGNERYFPPASFHAFHRSRFAISGTHVISPAAGLVDTTTNPPRRARMARTSYWQNAGESPGRPGRRAARSFR